MKKIIKASASGAKYAPIIGRDLDWFEGDIERYVGKNAATLKKFLKDQDFVLDEMSGPARDSAWESWRLDTEAGNIMVVFYYDLIPTPNSGRLKDGKVTKAYVEDNQDSGAIRDEETRLFSSRKIGGSKKRIVADELVKSSRRVRGKAVKASRRRKAIRCAADGHDPWAMIEAQKPVIIKRWSSEDYTGTPNTSWDWIFDGVLEDFKLYADDEASADETGATLLDNFIESDFDEIDMLDAFNEFIMWRDINDYDVE